MDNVLEVRNLRKNYSRFELQDVSFTVPEGCIAGFVGNNGAGKTTTIRGILNLIHRDGGQVNILGMDMYGGKESEQEIKNRIGVVTDNGGFYGMFTLKETASLFASLYKNWDDSVYKDWIRKFSLNEKQKIQELSRGMKVKFSLALAMSHHAEFLIMDEPSSGLDLLTRSWKVSGSIWSGRAEVYFFLLILRLILKRWQILLFSLTRAGLYSRRRRMP